MLEQALGLARAPISNFRVGAVAEGLSGTCYLGFNLEFPGQALQQSVHAEQAALALAHAGGELGLVRLSVSAAPCGHCRQFLQEAQVLSPLELSWPGTPALGLEQLLPQGFGPRDLGQTRGFLEVPREPLLGQGLELARRAGQGGWAPYSGSRCGLALRCGERWFPGCYLENAAFNPSLNPLQYALVLARSQGFLPQEVEEICFWEEPGLVSLWPATEILTSTLPKVVILAKVS